MRQIEDAASLAIRTASIRLDVEAWPADGVLRLPIGPLAFADPAPSVTIGGEPFTAFTVRTGTRPELRLTGELTTEQAAGEVTITYAAGWPDAASVPHDLRHAVADQVASAFDRRGAASRREQTLSPHTARVIAAWRGVSA